MNRITTFLLLALASCAQAYGQGAVLQSGIVTPGHGVQWLSNGIVGDTGQSATGATPCPSYPCTFTGLDAIYEKRDLLHCSAYRIVE